MAETQSRSNPARHDSYPGLVALGTRVELELVDQSGVRERLELDLVPDSAADFEAGFLAAGTPLAQAIMGRPAGTVVAYRAGDMIEVRILAVAPSTREPDSRAAANRQALVNDALEQAELEEMIRLALTVEVKWGNYDPEGLIGESSRNGQDTAELIP